MPVANPNIDKLKQVISSLPEKPGVYKYYDSQGLILYIGKAKSLKKRVASYFNKNQHDSKRIAILVKKIFKIEYTVVDTEMDALLLENNLIKEFQPRYNVNLKDDKTYPYIRITNERFPRIYPTRNPVEDGSEYFGPYASVTIMRVVLEFVKKLHPLRTCSLNLSEKNIENKKFKICLEYQLGNCLGPCEGLQSQVDYNQGINNIKNVLKGNLGPVKNILKEEMKTASEEWKFEEAHKLKEKLDLLDRYQGRSTVVNSKINNVDVFQIKSNDQHTFVNYLKVANGMIIQTKTIEIKRKLAENDAEVLELAIGEIRNRFKSNAKEIIVPFSIDLDTSDIKITIPKAGDKKKLLDLSEQNVRLFMREMVKMYDKMNPSLKTDRLMERMKTDLKLKEEPRHIECFDNSNIQGEFPVSACVVFKNGKPAKKDYRHFNIKTVEGPDDFASMYEAVFRRYKRLKNEELPFPQLIVIDGGKGQLNAAVSALKDLEVYHEMAICGIAKRLEEIYYPNDPIPLHIDKKSETLKIIQQLRDEAHRFGITHHRKKRGNALLSTELTQIEGIGPRTAKELLKVFKSVKQIKLAELKDLEKAIGLDKAQKIKAYFEAS